MDFYAPIVQMLLVRLGTEERSKGRRVFPDQDFNIGRLFLIPKTGTGTIDDTRPISVTNATNRIIAKCMAAAILPTLQRQLHHSQKGYLNERDGGDHIKDTNTDFYKAVQSNETRRTTFCSWTTESNSTRWITTSCTAC